MYIQAAVVVGDVVFGDDADLVASGKDVIFAIDKAPGTATGAGKNPRGGCGMDGAGTKAVPSGANAGPGLGPGNIIDCMNCAWPWSTCAALLS